MIQNQKQGDKKFKAGKDNLTTGVFQWSKDYTSGASNFTQAVKCFIAAEKYEKALLALKQLIICNEKLLDSWAVARNYEEMLNIYLKNMPGTSIQVLKQTASSGFQHFLMAESIDKGLQMLSRVAKELISKGQVKQGAQILQTAYEAASGDEKSFKKKQLLHQIVQVYLENDIYSQVERVYFDLCKAQGQNYEKAQYGLIKVLMIIIQHEPTRAQKEMYELSNYIPGFLQSDECETADELIKAYKKGDKQLFIKWTTKAAITAIFPVIIIKKLREVKVPSASQPKQGGNNEEENIKNLLY